MGLLDDIAKGHTSRRREVDGRVEAQSKAAAEEAQRLAAEAKRREEKRAAFEASIQRGPKPWSFDVSHSVGSLHVGGTFEFVNAEELDGKYVVVQVKIPKMPADPPPTLWAARDDGNPPAPPYVQIDEATIREEIAYGRLRVLSTIPKAAPPPTPAPAPAAAAAPAAPPPPARVTEEPPSPERRYTAADAFGGSAPKKKPAERPLLVRFDDDA